MTDDLAGGTGAHLTRMLAEWDRTHWAAQIVCHGEVDPGVSSPFPLHLSPRAPLYHHLPVAQLRNLATVASHARSFRPDVLHTYFFWSIVYGRILRRGGIVRRLVENREDHGFSWVPWQYRILRATRRIPDRVVCVCESVRRHVLDREGVPPDRTLVIHNGVSAPPVLPPRDASRARFGFEPGSPIVGMVANLNRPVKGVEYFLDAMPAILAAVPAARFVVFGHGHLQPDLERRARERGVSSAVCFAGFETDRDRIYSAIDVSVLTSLSEGLSITILESMAYGIPVVVTDVGGNREVVRDGVTGWVVPPRDVAQFASRVVQLLCEPERRSAMGREARRICREQFATALVSDRYLDVYGSLLGEEGSRPA